MRGTGAFIGQITALLKTDAAGLSEPAQIAGTNSPIAARCGVFARTGIQPLINGGAPRASVRRSSRRPIWARMREADSRKRRAPRRAAALHGPAQAPLRGSLEARPGDVHPFCSTAFTRFNRAIHPTRSPLMALEIVKVQRRKGGGSCGLPPARCAHKSASLEMLTENRLSENQCSTSPL
jgi:hypothetical protein